MTRRLPSVPVPQIVVWEITLQCNLACGHCGSRAGRARATEMTTAECLSVIEQLGELGTREIALIGGEALLRPDWDRLARAIADRRMLCSVVTGGRGLDRATAQRARRAGVGHVSVSVDGLASAHDRLRGVSGSHAAAWAALAHLRAAGVPASVNTTLNRDTVGDLEALVDALGTQGIQSWMVTLTVPMGRAGERPEMLLQPEDLLTLFPRLASLKARCQELGFALIPGNNVGYFGPYERVLRGELARHGYWDGCAAGAEVLGLEADGTIKGCPSLPTRESAGGNVRTTPVRTLLEQSPVLRAARERTGSELWGFCATCYYAEPCQGGCRWTGTALFGRPGNNPYCHHRVLTLARQGLRERLVQTSRPPGEPFDHGRFEIVLETGETAHGTTAAG